MRILVVSQYFWPESFPINQLASTLRARGHEVVVLTGFPNYPTGKIYPGYRQRLFQREDHGGIEVIRVPLHPDRSYSPIRRGWNYLSFMLSATALGPLLVGRVDRIIVFQVSPITAAFPAVVLRALRRAPLYLWVQDIWPETLEATDAVRHPLVLRLVRRFVDFIYRHSDVILVQSRGFIDRIRSAGVDAAKLVYLPNWADDLYRPVPRDEDLARKEDMAGGFHVVFAGNIGRAQDFDTLLGAATRLRHEPAIRFVILGDGAMAEHYAERARAEGLVNMDFKGRKAAEAMPRYFALADALLVLLRREPVFALTVPTKLQAYLACGRPVVAAVEGDAAAVVRESGGGVVCKPGDPDALAEAILRLYRLSPGEREAIGRAASAFGRTHFDRTAIIDRLERLLEAGPPAAR